MKVAELSEHRRFRFTEMRDEAPGAGEVRVRVKAVGICGSDVHYFSEGGIGDTPCVYPMVLGHEPTGEVIEVGAGVTGVSAGDRAILEPAVYCYHCEYCLTGHHNVCANIKFLSTPAAPGFFREYVTLPASNVLPVPENLSFEEATLFEPFAVTLHSLEFAQLRLGETVAVFGAGPIGLLTIASLKLAGAGRIFSIEPLAHRRELAREMGADVTIDPTAVNVVAEILKDTGRRGVDAAFDCVTKGESMSQAIDSIRNAGRFIVTGIPSEMYVSLPFHTLRRKEIHVFNVRRSNHETPAALDFMRAYPKKLGALVTHKRPIDSIQGAFEMLERYEDGVGKVVLTF